MALERDDRGAEDRNLQLFRARQRLADDQKLVALADLRADDLGHIVNQPHRANGRRRQDRGPVGFIVERDIARHDRHIERRAGRADAFDRADELPHDLRLFGVAEIEVVSRCQRLGSDSSQVAPDFSNGLFAAFERIGFDIARCYVGARGNGFCGAVDADHGGISTRSCSSIRLDQVVILMPDPALGAHVGCADDLEDVEILESEKWLAKPILTTGDHTWNETAKLEGAVEYNEGADTLGPLTIGLSLERELEQEDSEELITKQQRIVILGDGDFLSNTYLANSGNNELGTRLINWLSSDDDFISIPPKVANDTQLNMSPTTLGVIGIGFLFILPTALVVIGITTGIRRKKK